MLIAVLTALVEIFLAGSPKRCLKERKFNTNIKIYAKEDFSWKRYFGHVECGFQNPAETFQWKPGFFLLKVRNWWEKCIFFDKSFFPQWARLNTLSVVPTTLPQSCRQRTGLFPSKSENLKQSFISFKNKLFFCSKRFSWCFDWNFDIFRKIFAKGMNISLQIQ